MESERRIMNSLRNWRWMVVKKLGGRMRGRMGGMVRGGKGGDEMGWMLMRLEGVVGMMKGGCKMMSGKGMGGLRGMSEKKMNWGG